MSLFVWLYGMLASVLLSILYLAIAPMDISPGDQIAVIAAGTVILVFAPMANIFHRQVAAAAFEPLRQQPVPVGGLNMWRCSSPVISCSPSVYRCADRQTASFPSSTRVC